MPNVIIDGNTYKNVNTIRLRTTDGEKAVFEHALWAYLDRNTLYLNRAHDFKRNDTTLEVCYG